jgi:hypothetical protein
MRFIIIRASGREQGRDIFSWSAICRPPLGCVESFDAKRITSSGRSAVAKTRIPINSSRADQATFRRIRTVEFRL